MELTDQASEPQVSEGGGLRVTYNEGDSSFTLEWDSETHPEYNYLKDFSETELSDYLIGVLREQLDELENTPDTENHAN